MLQVHVWGSLSKNLWLSHHQLKDPSHMGKVNLFWYLETVSMCTTRQTQVRAGFCTARTGSRDWHLHSATCTGESKLTFLQQTKGQMDSCNKGTSEVWTDWGGGESTAIISSPFPVSLLLSNLNSCSGKKRCFCWHCVATGTTSHALHGKSEQAFCCFRGISQN